MSFRGLGLSEAVLHGVQRMGYVEPTPIQEKAIPVILSGRDLIASAQTGTGKTAAFALPLLTRLGEARRGGGRAVRCLVLEPTRELAIQVEEAFRDFGYFTHVGVGVVHGGVGFSEQRRALQGGCEVVVATPGRLLDHMGRGDAKLGTVRYLVLDEVDRMLDMGFLPDVRRIIGGCPRKRQTMVFSATIPEEIDRLAAWCLRDPERVEVGARRSPAETVTHAFYPVANTQKFALLVAILERIESGGVLIFTRTREGADRIAGQLKMLNHSVAVLHSDRTQAERVKALEGFRRGDFEVMVATDIAARGIDVAGVTHVINYDVPLNPEDYVHRIGRTGRAASEGDAMTLITAEEYPHVKAIERFIRAKVPRVKLDGFSYEYSMIFDERGVEQVLKGAKGVRGLKGTTFGRRRR